MNDVDDALKKLSQNIRIEQANERRLRAIEQRIDLINERFAELINIVRLQRQQVEIYGATLDEFREELHIRLMATEGKNIPDNATIHLDHSAILGAWVKALQKLKEREANYGGEAPVYLLNQIEALEEKIEEIQAIKGDT